MTKEFYFVRHGQTDHNVSEIKNRGDHPPEIPLNQTGRGQALAIEPLIATLPVQSICASPMKRVQETKEIIAARLQVHHFELETLSECTSKIWHEMSRHGMYSPPPIDGEARLFIDRVYKGVTHALALPGPSLIVAHGGVHWAICSLLEIQEHEWAIENCAVVHFKMGEQGKWSALKLS